MATRAMVAGNMGNRKKSGNAADPIDRNEPDVARPEVMFRTCDLARVFGVDQTTILRWCRSMQLPSHRLPSGHRRFKLNEVRAWFASALDEATEEPDDTPIDVVST